MSITYKVSEKRKQDLILLASKSRGIKVEGVYYPGCQLTLIDVDHENKVLKIK